MSRSYTATKVKCWRNSNTCWIVAYKATFFLLCRHWDGTHSKESTIDKYYKLYKHTYVIDPEDLPERGWTLTDKDFENDPFAVFEWFGQKTTYRNGKEEIHLSGWDLQDVIDPGLDEYNLVQLELF